MKTCPNCHAAVQDDAMFCTSCGTSFQQNTASNQPNQNGGYYQSSQPQHRVQPVQPQTPPRYNVAPNMAMPKHEFFEAYKLYWKNYTNFTDRTRCSDYWYVFLMNFLIFMM